MVLISKITFPVLFGKISYITFLYLTLPVSTVFLCGCVERVKSLMAARKLAPCPTRKCLKETTWIDFNHVWTANIFRKMTTNEAVPSWLIRGVSYVTLYWCKLHPLSKCNCWIGFIPVRLLQQIRLRTSSAPQHFERQQLRYSNQIIAFKFTSDMMATYSSIAQKQAFNIAQK